MCGRCGRSIQVRYNKGRSYYCNWRTVELGQSRSCFSVGGIGIDAVVARHFLERLSAARDGGGPGGGKGRVGARRSGAAQLPLELEQCRYEASLAERRYRRVDPDNRLIAATLEREWEAALGALERAELALKAARERQPEAPPPGYFADLGASLERVWHAPTTTSRDRKRLLACLVEEITLQVVEEDQTEVVIHWRGGETDAFAVPRQRTKPVRQVDDLDTVQWVRRLAPIYPDVQIARILNDQGRRSARGLVFSVSLVQRLRYRHGIAGYRPSASGEEDGEVLSVRAAAEQLGVSESTLYRWVHAGVLPSVHPALPGAPVRVRLNADFRSRFHLDPPEGFVPLRDAVRRLGVSRQTIWQRVASGRLDSCHVKRGPNRGLHVRLEPDDLPLLRKMLADEEEPADG